MRCELSRRAAMRAAATVIVLWQPSASASESTSDVLEEVTVFGERFEETDSYIAPGSTVTKSDTPLKDVPFALSAITRALIDDQQPLLWGDALRNVAGAQPQTGFGVLNSRPRIRGFTPTQTLRNGFRQATFSPDIDLAAIAQIEVLKGPASALYGRFEPGGLVNVVSKRPQSSPHASVELITGSDAYYRGALDVGGGLTGDGRVLYRLNAAYQDSDSYRDFFHTEKLYVAPVVEWRISPDTALVVELEGTWRDAGFDRGYIVPTNAAFGRSLLTLPLSRNLGERTDHTDYRAFVGSATLDHRLNHAWAIRGGVMFSDTYMEEDFFTSGSPQMPNATTYNRRRLYAFDDADDVTALIEIRGRVTAGAFGHQLLIGVDANEENYRFDALRVPTNSPINPFAPIYGQAFASPTVRAFGGTNRFRAVGAYLQDEIAWAERWRLLLGGRYDWTNARQLTLGPPDTTLEQDVGKFSPRAAVSFAVTREVSLYANYARSFIPEVGGVLLSGEQTAPSVGTQYEAGIKTEFLSGRLVATAARYDIKKTNIVVSDPDNPGFSLQLGEQRSRGTELELIAQLREGWNLIASYAHADATTTRDTNPVIVGKRIVNVPEHTASFWTTYDLSAGANAAFQVGGGVFHVSDRAVNNANLFFLPSYTRYDAMASYTRGPWRLALNVQNLTDEHSYDSAGGTFHPLPPRQWFLNIEHRFL